jgi:hypothetical protein
MPAVSSASAAASGMPDAALDHPAAAGRAPLGTAPHAEMPALLQRAQAELAAVNAAVPAAFTAQGGYEPDGHRPPRAWLAGKNGMTRAGAARSRRLARHGRIAEAITAGDISGSWTREIAVWAGRLPAGRRDNSPPGPAAPTRTQGGPPRRRQHRRRP